MRAVIKTVSVLQYDQLIKLTKSIGVLAIFFYGAG